MMVTDDFFQTLGIPFLIGRGIAPGWNGYGGYCCERIWRSAFGQDPAILGRKVILEGRATPWFGGVLPANNRSIFGFGVLAGGVRSGCA